jgi:hypothetical protein
MQISEIDRVGAIRKPVSPNWVKTSIRWAQRAWPAISTNACTDAARRHIPQSACAAHRQYLGDIARPALSGVEGDKLSTDPNFVAKVRDFEVEAHQAG